MKTSLKFMAVALGLLSATCSHAQRVVPVPALTVYQQECSVYDFAHHRGAPSGEYSAKTVLIPS